MVSKTKDQCRTVEEGLQGREIPASKGDRSSIQGKRRHIYEYTSDQRNMDNKDSVK